MEEVLSFLRNIPNISGIIAGAIVSTTLTYIFVRRGKRIDYRAAAEQALIESGPKIITELRTQCNELGRQITDLWKELNSERDRHRECLERVAALERRLRK